MIISDKNGKVFFWVFQLLISVSIFAFNPTNSVANQNIFLLKNNQNILPISDLDSDIFVVQSNFSGQEEFNSTISKYTTFSSIEFNQIQQKINNDFPKKSRIILPIDLDEVKAIPLYFFDEKNQSKLIIAAFSDGAPIDFSFEDWKVSAIVFSNKNKASVKLVAQSIFGGAPLHNLSGEEVFDGKSRLGYSLPESVGVDSIFLNEKIDSVVQLALDAEAFPGVQILIAKEGKVVFHKTYGFQTYDKKQVIEPTDIYDLASISKVTTSLPILMKYYGNNQFDLDAPLKTYFPKFKKSNKADLTFREILAHQAGLRPWIPYWTNTLREDKTFKRRTFKSKKSWRYNVKITDHLFLHRKYKKKIYKAIKESKLNDEKKYKYSGLAFYILPEIVEDLTGQNYESYLKNQFYKPLGATTITFNPLNHFPKERIIPTEDDTFFRKTQLHGTVHDEGAAMMGGLSSNAGLFASANDLAKLLQMYLNGGTYGGKRFIAEKAIKEFTRCQFPENDNRRGLGFDKPLLEYHPTNSSVAKDASPASYGHSGYTGTFFWIDPEHELIYIFLSNRVYPTRENRKIYELNIRPTIHQIIYDSFLKR